MEPIRLALALNVDCFRQLTRFVDGAARLVCLTMYEFDPGGWPPLVATLNAAAARGVRVMVAVNQWQLKPASRRCARALAQSLLPAVELRLWRHVFAHNTHSK